MLNPDAPASLEQAQTGRPGAVVIEMAGVRVKRDGVDGACVEATGVAVIDWDVLFSAVTARLQQIVGSCQPADPIGRDAQGQILQCVGALEQLHATMLRCIERGNALETSLSSAQAALTAARAELARARAGERAPSPM